MRVVVRIFEHDLAFVILPVSLDWMLGELLDHT